MALFRKPITYFAIQAGILLGLSLVFLPDARTLTGPFEALINWDATHYLKHVESDGYHMPDKPISELTAADIHTYQANVLYFPAWPEWVRWTHVITQLSPQFLLVFWAFVFCAGFWWLLSENLKRLAPSQDPTPYLMAVMLYPSAFFIALPYTESLFMLALMGWIYFCGTSTRLGLFGSALSGLALVGSRLVGLPLVIYPVLVGWRERWSLKQVLIPIFFAMSIFVGFLVYCQTRFGVWNLYEVTQTVGWGIQRDYLAVFNPMNYIPRFFFEDTYVSFNRSVVPAFAILFVWLLNREKKLLKALNFSLMSAQQFRRGVLYAASLLIFYIVLTSRAKHHMDLVLRYLLPAHVLLVLNWASLDQEQVGLFRKSPVPKKLQWVFLLLLAAIELWCMQRYIRGKWIA